MDDRDHHDTNVVSLRRKDDLRGRDQDQVASTIFAEQDEISTFSQGNLVPPRPAGQAVDEGASPADDPFFEQHLRQSSADRQPTSDAKIVVEADEYFAELVAQSATEMADRLRSRQQSPAVAMPGSASLPVDAARIRRRGWRVASQGGPRRHLSRSVVIFVSTGLLAGAALALIVVFLGHQPGPGPRPGTDPQLASMLSVDRNPFNLEVHSSSRSAKAAAHSRHTARPQRTRSAGRIRTAVRVRRARRSTTSASAASVAPTNVSQPAGSSSSGSATGAPATSSPASNQALPQTSSTPSSGQAASSNNPPAFGPNGTLAPGHSSIG
jgi:hypothetical protein